MNLQKHLKEIIITLSVISITAVGYAAVSSVSSGETLTATLWNEMKDIVNSNEAKLTNIESSGGNVGIGITSPSGALHIKTKASDIIGGFIIEDDNSTEKCGIYIVGSNTECTNAGGSILDTGTSQYTLCARCE